MSIEQPYAGCGADRRLITTILCWYMPAQRLSRAPRAIISSPGGWYDAGDYNKYVVNSAYSIGLIQAVCQMIPDYMASLKLDIPENTNDPPMCWTRCIIT